MKLLSDIKQDTDEWHARRKISIGSSDASVIMQIDPYRTYDQLLLEKTGKIKPNFEMNPAMFLGKKWEGSAREMFNLVHDWDVQPVVGVNDEFDYIIASFDGLCETEKTFVEIKYAGLAKTKVVEKTKELPKHHYAQVQHQFLVSGYDKAFYIPYSLTKDKKAIDKIVFIEIKRDEKYIQSLLEKELEFKEKVKQELASA